MPPAHATWPDFIVFVIAGGMCVVGSLGIIIRSNPVHCALSLILTLFGIAVLFVEQQAQFLAAVQIIVYAGAIVVLFLFVIMLIGVDRVDSYSLVGKRVQVAILSLISVAFFVEIWAFGSSSWVTGKVQTTPAVSSEENIKGVANVVFQRYLFPFELTSALLLIAVIGAVVLARRSEPVSPVDLREPAVLPGGEKVDA